MPITYFTDPVQFENDVRFYQSISSSGNKFLSLNKDSVGNYYFQRLNDDGSYKLCNIVLRTDGTSTFYNAASLEGEQNLINYPMGPYIDPFTGGPGTPLPATTSLYCSTNASNDTDMEFSYSFLLLNGQGSTGEGFGRIKVAMFGNAFAIPGGGDNYTANFINTISKDLGHFH